MYPREVLTTEEGSIDDDDLAVQLDLKERCVCLPFDLRMLGMGTPAQAVVDELENGCLACGYLTRNDGKRKMLAVAEERHVVIPALAEETQMTDPDAHAAEPQGSPV